jgi:hypothetical protein
MRKEFRSPKAAIKRESRRALAWLWLLAPGLGLLSGEIIDRMAVSVGNQVITEGQIDEEIRLTAFLNHELPDASVTERKKAAGRLIEQALIKRDMDLSRYPPPAPAEVDASLHEVQSSYAPDLLYRKKLQECGITESALKARLLWQLTLLRFVDYRFRPGIQISDADVKSYYDHELGQWKQQDIASIPTFDDSRPKIEEILTQQRIDQALDSWMADTRKQVPINYLDESLK